MEIRDRVKELRRVKAGELLPNPRNWRTHPAAQRDALKGILAEIGYADALLAREVAPERFQLIDGHLRAETTPDTLVPVLVLDLDEAEAAKLLAVLDPLAAMAQADAGKLDALLRDVQTGSEALAGMLADLAADNGIIPAEANGAGGDEFDPTPEESGPTRTSLGEVWVIGDVHRLLVGDCTKAENVARLMAGQKVRLCFTSPPYAEQREYGGDLPPWDTLMQGAFACLPMEEDGQVLVNLGLVHRDGEWLPYWDGWIEWMRGQGWRRFGWYVWDQGAALPGDWSGRLAPSHEWVFHFNRVAAKPEKCVPCKYAGEVAHGRTFRNSDGTLDGFTGEGQPYGLTRIPDSVIRVNRQHGRGIHSDHPAVFPVGLPGAVMQAWPGDVYDPFLGSGTTLIAAHRLKRKCYGCEIEPRYADVILKRAEAEGLSVEKG